MEDIILKCERIEKKYSKTKALDNINLSIYTGHIYALIGENGAGKTTLMRIISGLIGSDNGKMELKSKNIGALIEKPAFYPGLTAKENIKIISDWLHNNKKGNLSKIPFFSIDSRPNPFGWIRR